MILPDLSFLLSQVTTIRRMLPFEKPVQMGFWSQDQPPIIVHLPEFAPVFPTSTLVSWCASAFLAIRAAQIGNSALKSACRCSDQSCAG